MRPCHNLALLIRIRLIGLQVQFYVMQQDKVDECSKLIHELTSRGYGRHFNKRKFGSVPGSPNGVMDLSFSSDSSTDSWAVAVASVTWSPEPLSKKIRVQQHATNADFLRIPR